MVSPFETLGLLPSLVNELNDDRIRIVVTEIGKALQFFFHPDKIGGTGIRSVAINSAVSIVEHTHNLKDLRETYLERGPGQFKVRSAENELLAVHQTLAGVEENITRTEITISDFQTNTVKLRIKKQIDETFCNSWVLSLYSQSFSGKEVVNVKPSLVGEKDEDVVQFDSLYLPYTTNQRFLLIPYSKFYKSEASAERLQELLDIDVEQDEKEKTDICNLKCGITYINNDTKKYKHVDEEGLREKERKEEELEKIKKKRKARKAEIKALRRKMSDGRETDVVAGYIDADGYITIGAKKTGLRVVGTTNHAEVDDETISDLRPFLVKGSNLLGATRNGEFKMLGILQDFEKSSELSAYIHTRLRTRTKKGETTEKKRGDDGKRKPTETALILQKQTEVTYAKNPFEMLGLLPSLVGELSTENLRHVISVFSKSLQRVYHPDTGGNPVRFSEIMTALQLLKDQTEFEKAKACYATSAPGTARIAAINQVVSDVTKQTIERIKELARLKAKEEQARREAVKEVECRRLFRELLLEDLFCDQPRPPNNPDALYLRHAHGAHLLLSTAKISQQYRLEVNGFNVFGISLTTSKKMPLMGSTTPHAFKAADEAQKILIETVFENLYKHVHPVLYPKGFLVGIKVSTGSETATPKILGMIEEIDVREGRVTARKMASGLDALRERKKSRIERPTRRC